MGGPGTHTIIGLHISDAESLGSITRFIKEQITSQKIFMWDFKKKPDINNYEQKMYSKKKKLTEEKVNLNFSQNTTTFKSFCMYQTIKLKK